MMRRGMQRKLFDIYVYVGSDIEKNWSYVKLEIYLDGKYRTLNSICSSLGGIELYTYEDNREGQRLHNIKNILS